jgi:hypothetical protein
MRERDKKQVVKILTCVRELFSDKQRWAQGVFRKKAWDEDNYTAWCLVGGVNECAGFWKAHDTLASLILDDKTKQKAQRARDRAEAKATLVTRALTAVDGYNRQLTVINDVGGYNAVIDLIDKALAEYST